MPATLAARVEVAPWNQPVVEAFNRLTQTRASGPGGPQPISLGEIKAYLDLFGPDDPEARAERVDLIQAMDRVWLELARAGTESALKAEADHRAWQAKRHERPRGTRG